MKCLSCNKEFTKGTSFECPGCDKKKITRCLRCKRLNTPFECSCGFEGP